MSMPLCELLKSYQLDLLAQGRSVLRSCLDEHYGFVNESWFPFSIGVHFRHVTDHYDCFFAGLDEGRVDYDRRCRDLDLESSRVQMIDNLGVMIDLMGAIDVDVLESSCWINANARGEMLWAKSSGARELQFLEAHTVHHYAIIAMVLRKQGVEVPSYFGIAPSTWRFWQERAVCGDRG